MLREYWRGSGAGRDVVMMWTVRDFTYLDDRVNAGGGCEADVFARARCKWVRFMECGEWKISSKVDRGCL